jgi:hypothetical protein
VIAGAAVLAAGSVLVLLAPPRGVASRVAALARTHDAGLADARGEPGSLRGLGLLSRRGSRALGRVGAPLRRAAR